MRKLLQASVLRPSRSRTPGRRAASLHPRGRTILAAVAVACALSLGLAAPAFAAPGDTTTTFALTGGALAISVPATATLSSSPTGGLSTISGPLGSVAVTDARGLLGSSWTTSATSTAFKTGGGTAPETTPTLT